MEVARSPIRHRGLQSASRQYDMFNPLLLPELREMLAEQDTDQLRAFCTELHPARTAEFMEGLTAAEAWAVLRYA